MSTHRRQAVGLLASCALVLLCDFASASGFQLNEQSARKLGEAYSGTAATADDASIAYYNSAGLTRIREEQVVFSAVGAATNTHINADHATPNFTGARLPIRPVSGIATRGGLPSTALVRIPGSVQDIGPGIARSRPLSLLPGLHYAKRINDCMVFGMSVAMPFGLDVKYKIDSVARYMSTRSAIRTYDISPSLGIALGNGFSVGGGVDFVHTLAKIDARVGYGAAQFDGLSESTVSRWAVGGHVGVLYEITDCTRFGVQYRSGYKAKTQGTSILETPAIPSSIVTLPNVRGATFATLPIPSISTVKAVRANLRLPDSVVFSAHSNVTEEWALMMDVQWTHWKKFNEIRAFFDDGTVFTQRFDFRDTTRVAVGTHYQFDECWLGRLGVAYDRTPVKNANLRTTLIPDSSRYWGAFGVQYRFTECLALDVGYAHLFFNHASINQGPPSWTLMPQSRQSIRGRYRSRADLIGLQLTWDLV